MKLINQYASDEGINLTNMQKLLGKFYNKSGVTDIVLFNDFQTFKTEIFNVEFEGNEFSDLKVNNRSQISSDALDLFDWDKRIEAHTEIKDARICNARFELELPLVLIHLPSWSERRDTLLWTCELGPLKENPSKGIEFETYKLQLQIYQYRFEGQGESMEDALLSLKKTLSPDYILKNCFGCQYGDYSIFGQTGFGGMRCYKGQANEYDMVTDKDSYYQLEKKAPLVNVQEIYLCEDFTQRKPDAGYRG